MSNESSTNISITLNLPECLLAFDVITNVYAQIVRSLFMILQLIQILAFLLLAIEFMRRSKKVPLHGNLKLLYIHLVVIYQLASIGYPMAELRNIVLSIFYGEWKCSMMTPIWYIFISRGLVLVYTYAVPSLHFAIMLERYRATKLAENYELTGNNFGRIILGLIYFLTFAMAASILCLFLRDNEYNLNNQSAFNTALSKSNGQLAQYFTIFQVILVLLTVVGDFQVYNLNKRLRRERIILNYVVASQRVITYNLSKNYQLHENYMAMRVILPLDITYMLFILIFNLLVYILRSNQTGMSTAIFLAHYNMLSCLLSLYTIVSLVIYRQFLLYSGPGGKRARNPRGNDIVPMEKIGQIYFDQLKMQWNTIPKEE